MQLLQFKIERYQFHYPEGKESAVRGISQEPTEVIINADNLIMTIGREIYLRVSDTEYVTMLTDSETILTICDAIKYNK